MTENKENKELKTAQEQIEEAPEQEVRHFGGSVLKRNKETGEVTRSSYVGPGEELMGEEEETEEEAAGTEANKGQAAPPQPTQLPAPAPERAPRPTQVPAEAPKQGTTE